LEKENSNKSMKVILIAVIILLLIVIGVLVFVVLNKKEQAAQVQTSEAVNSGTEIAYDTGAVVTDEESLQKAYDEMVEKAKEGSMALEMKTEAISSDGENFECKLANSVKNKYDMYMVLYRDDTQEEIYRSGLIPIGKEISSFKVNKKLEKGTYVCTLVYNQVEDDHSTVHAQVNVGLNLIVD